MHRIRHVAFPAYSRNGFVTAARAMGHAFPLWQGSR